MNFAISTELPFWLILLCLAAGVGVALLLYRRNDELKKPVLQILFALRAISFAAIAFLLLSPVVKSFDPSKEKPVVIIGEDHSQSVVELTDSLQLQKYRLELEQLLDEYQDRFEFHTYSFGEDVREGLLEEFKDQLTDISTFMKDMEDRHENRNVAFMVLASDGRFNKGNNPIYRPSTYPYPVYALVMGDTLIKPDFAVNDIKHNKLAFLGNQFEAEAEIRATHLKGNSGQMVVRNNGKTIYQQVIEVPNDDFRQKVKFTLPASNAGLQRYEVEVIPFQDEVNVSNNRRYFFVDVIEDQQKVLILAATPHPDVKALLSAINESRNYKATTAIAKHFKGDLKEYNLLILHQVPSAEGMPAQVQAARDIPVLYILGKQSSVPVLNNLSSGLTIDGFRARFNEVVATVDPSFGSFSVGIEVAEILPQMPPLISPMGTYNLHGEFKTLCSQKIGNVQTPYPLIGFYQRENVRVGWIAGEGLWKWRLYNYRLNGNTELFDELVRKCVQFLAIRDDKSRFRVASEPSWFEHEEVVFQAEYYDQAYAPNLDQEITLKVTDTAGQDFEYRFLPVRDQYETSLGKLPEGDYQWTAYVKVGSESFSKSGSFTIKPLQLEQSEFQADQELMFNLSQANGGEMWNLSEFNTALEELLQNERYQPVIHLKENLKDLISYKLLFFLILLLLTSEWALRKWFGMR